MRRVIKKTPKKQVLYIFSVPGMFNNGNERGPGYQIFRDILNKWVTKELSSPEPII